MKMSAVLAVALGTLLLVAGPAFAAGEQEATGAEPKWMQIQWNEPVPWAERLQGVELADQPPQAFIDNESWMADQPKKTISVGGYIWPEGWEEAVDGVEELSFFNFGGLPHDPAIGAAIAAFEEKTGITIEAQAMEETGIWLKTVSSMTAKSGEPVLVQSIPAINLQHMAAAEWVEPINFFWPEEVQELYGQGLVDLVKVGGDFYASGYISVKPFVLFYRPSILEEVTGSSEPPRTWSDLKDVASQVAQQTDKYGLAIPGKNHTYVWYVLSSVLYSMGGQSVNEEGQFDPTSEEYQRAFEYMVNLVRDGATPTEALGWSWTDSPAVFSRGRSAFLIAGTVNATRFEDEQPAAIRGDWDYVTIPNWGEPGTGITHTLNPTAFSVNKYASESEKAAALLFMDLYRSYQSQWNEIAFEGNEVGVPALYEMDSVRNAVSKPETRREAVLNSRAETLPINGEQMLKYQLEWWAKATSGEVGIQEALDNLVQDVESIR